MCKDSKKFQIFAVLLQIGMFGEDGAGGGEAVEVGEVADGEDGAVDGACGVVADCPACRKRWGIGAEGWGVRV